MDTMAIFENQKNRENQDRLQWILEHYGYGVEQTSTLCSYDFRVYKGGKIHALVEYKARDRFWDPLNIDEHKIRSLVGAAQEWKAKPIFVVGFEGPPYYFTEAHTNYPTTSFLRTKGGEVRRETTDIVFQIPKKEFKLLG